MTRSILNFERITEVWGMTMTSGNEAVVILQPPRVEGDTCGGVKVAGLLLHFKSRAGRICWVG